jgi:hypothetical protein
LNPGTRQGGANADGHAERSIRDRGRGDGGDHGQGEHRPN